MVPFSVLKMTIPGQVVLKYIMKGSSGISMVRRNWVSLGVIVIGLVELKKTKDASSSVVEIPRR